MSKKAAIEMSMNTFVTIVLVVIVMVLAIFFIQKIFLSGTNAIDSIDSQVQSEINKLFADEGGKLAVYPSSKQITIKRGDDPKGFAFSVKNDRNDKSTTYKYLITASDVSDCGGSIIKTDAESYLLTKPTEFNLGPSASLDAELVLFKIPKSAPACTMVYSLEIKRGTESYASARIYLTTK